MPSRSKPFPPKQPPAYKVGVKHALPVGTWVTGRNAQGLQGLPGHVGHVIVIKAEPNKADVQFTNAGYRQLAACVSCGVPFINQVDGEFLQEKVGKDYLEEEVRRLDEVRLEAKRAIKKIEHRLR